MTVRKEYRVDGRDNYAVDYVPQSDGTYKIHCTYHPPDPHGKGASETHLFTSGDICVTSGREPRTLADATKIGKAWCEGYSRYLRTGKYPGN